MSKVLLNYDPATGLITDPTNNATIVTWPGLVVHEEPESNGSDAKVEKMIQLTNAGFDHDDVCAMVGKGLL